MNPEFRRQLWLQFSATRLGVLPLLMLVIFTAVYLSANEQASQAIAVASAVLLGALVWGMGTMAAGASATAATKEIKRTSLSIMPSPRVLKSVNRDW